MVGFVLKNDQIETKNPKNNERCKVKIFTIGVTQSYVRPCGKLCDTHSHTQGCVPDCVVHRVKAIWVVWAIRARPFRSCESHECVGLFSEILP